VITLSKELIKYFALAVGFIIAIAFMISVYVEIADCDVEKICMEECLPKRCAVTIEEYNNNLGLYDDGFDLEVLK